MWVRSLSRAGPRKVRKSDDKEPFAALAFKIAVDPFVGNIAFFRVDDFSLPKIRKGERRIASKE